MVKILIVSSEFHTSNSGVERTLDEFLKRPEKGRLRPLVRFPVKADIVCRTTFINQSFDVSENENEAA